jgi:hypothetical protein
MPRLVKKLSVCCVIAISSPTFAQDFDPLVHNTTAQNQTSTRTNISAAVIAEEQRLAIRESNLRVLNERNYLQQKALKWELSYLTLSAIDLAQTVNCLEKNKCVEANPIFGKHPKTSTLVAAKVLGGALHFAGFKYVSRRDPKTALRMAQISVGMQGAVVALNLRVGF